MIDEGKKLPIIPKSINFTVNCETKQITHGAWNYTPQEKVLLLQGAREVYMRFPQEVTAIYELEKDYASLVSGVPMRQITYNLISIKDKDWKPIPERLYTLDSLVKDIEARQ